MIRGGTRAKPRLWLAFLATIAVRTGSSYVFGSLPTLSRTAFIRSDDGFSRIQTSFYGCHRKRRLFQNTKSPETETTNEETRTLSDVDARVLRSMLSENKLDLETESDVRKLLQRGTVKTVEPRKVKVKEEKDDSGFSSQVFKTLADTKLWKKVSAQASDALESVSIWVSNKVEQDVKVLAALGIFAWDRAVRDVARALPAAGFQAKKILILTNSSSFRQQQEHNTKSVKEKMVRPEDEIKSVSRELIGILKGERTTPSGQGLRTAAPAGSGNAAERQRRAYQQRQKINRQKKDVTKIGGSVLDGAWELRREIKAEANVPGYKTEPARKAIEAGVKNTGNMLRAAQQQARLAAAQRKELRLRQAAEQNVDFLEANQPQPSQATFFDPTEKQANQDFSTTVKTDPVRLDFTKAVDTSVQTEPVKQDKNQQDLIAKLRAERVRVTERLQLCIESPNTTWLTASIADSVKEKDIFEGSGIEDSITKMILLKDELVDPTNEKIGMSLEIALGQLLTTRDSIEDLCLQVESSVSKTVADQLREEVYGEFDKELPLILRLEEVAKSLASAEQEPLSSDDTFFVATSEQEQMAAHFVDDDPEAKEDATTEFVPDGIIDVIPDAIVTEMVSNNAEKYTGIKATVFVEGVDATGVGLVAEIITDEDFDSAVGAAKVAVEVAVEEEAEKKEDSVLVQMTLRSLDIVFFVIEKILTVGIPGTTVLVKTALMRLEEVNREGKGSEGWQQFGNLADTKGKY